MRKVISSNRPISHRHQLALAIATIFAQQLAMAQSQTAPPKSQDLGTTVVTATRIETQAENVSGTVTSIERKVLDRRFIGSSADLFKDEPDIAMAKDLRRFGATRVNIRGIEDNRVLQTVDGVRLPDYYNGGGPTNFTMSATPGSMPDFLKQVEVVRGAASSLYGSDALAGVVGYITLKPQDLLGSEQTTATRLKLSYNGSNQGWTKTALFAARTGSVDWLFGASHNSAQETKNKGEDASKSPTRSKPNPQDNTDYGVLTKAIWRPEPSHKLSWTIEGRESQSKNDILRLATSMPKLTSMQGDDQVRRVRSSLEWEHQPQQAWYDRFSARLFSQNAQTHNHNIALRRNTSATCSAAAGAGNNCSLDQDFFFDQSTRGLNTLVEKAWESVGLTHIVSGGLDWSRVQVEEKRDAKIRNETTGTNLNSLAGETYPLRDFANGRTTQTGLFVQDEIDGLANGALQLAMGVRYDRTQLSPEIDALAQQTLSLLGRTLSAPTHSAVSPKISARWRVDPSLQAYAQLAKGFRAPNYSEVNGAFRNSSQFYSVVPNADLKPETSNGLELGLRGNSDNMRWHIAIFDNRYRDFIETVQLSCPSDPRCYAPSPAWRTNTSINLTKVRIYGAETRSSWTLAPSWQADFALAYSHGENQDNQQALNSIEPMRASAGLMYQTSAWGLETRIRGAARKKDVNDTPSPYFKPAAYATVDLSSWWSPSKNYRIQAGISNLLDKKYWLWSDIRQADAPNPQGVAFYSQPGRSFHLSLQADF